MPVKCRGCGEPLPMAEDDPYNELKHENNCLALKLGAAEEHKERALRALSDRTEQVLELESRLNSITNAVGAACAKRHPSYLNRTAEGHFCHACGLIDGLAQQDCILDRVVEKHEPLSERLKAKGFRETGEGDTISRKWPGPE